MEQSATVSDGAVTSAAEILREYGHHAGRFAFAGVKADPDSGRVTVFRVPSPAFDMDIVGLVDDVEIEIADAQHTRDELIVAREVAWAIGGAFEVESVVVPEDGTQVKVFVSGSTWDAQFEMDQAVPGLAEVVATRRNLEAAALVGLDRRAAR